jgi:FixJ family two-component response regulator
MLNILIITDKAEESYSLFNSAGFSPDSQDLRQQDLATEQHVSVNEPYDLAFLDLDVLNWQERLLNMRHRLPVTAVAKPDKKRAINAMKLGASDFLNTSSSLSRKIFLPSEIISKALRADNLPPCLF